MACHDKRRRIEEDLEEIFNVKVDENSNLIVPFTPPKEGWRGASGKLVLDVEQIL